MKLKLIPPIGAENYTIKRSISQKSWFSKCLAPQGQKQDLSVTSAGAFREMGFEFTGFVEPVIGVGRCVFPERNVWPNVGIFGVYFEPFFQARFSIGLDGIGRAFGFAYAAINALSRWIQ